MLKYTSLLRKGSGNSHLFCRRVKYSCRKPCVYILTKPFCVECLIALCGVVLWTAIYVKITIYLYSKKPLKPKSKGLLSLIRGAIKHTKDKQKHNNNKQNRCLVGIEPTFSESQPDALTDWTINTVVSTGFEPIFSESKSDVLTIAPRDNM